MNDPSTIGDVYARRNGDIDTHMIETKLMWMPGMRPVKVPAVTPRAIAMIISRNIDYAPNLSSISIAFRSNLENANHLFPRSFSDAPI